MLPLFDQHVVCLDISVKAKLVYLSMQKQGVYTSIAGGTLYMKSVRTDRYETLYYLKGLFKYSRVYKSRL